eukprot:5854694-Amphidinium_carterae.1
MVLLPCMKHAACSKPCGLHLKRASAHLQRHLPQAEVDSVQECSVICVAHGGQSMPCNSARMGAAKACSCLQKEYMIEDNN